MLFRSRTGDEGRERTTTGRLLGDTPQRRTTGSDLEDRLADLGEDSGGTRRQRLTVDVDERLVPAHPTARAAGQQERGDRHATGG